MGFKENLKGELDYKGMPVKVLAQKTGIPKQTIDKYLLNEKSTMPPADKAVTIAKVLGVTVEFLVTGSNCPEKKLPTRILYPETRSIVECVEQLPREKRKIAEEAVVELVRLLEQPVNSKPLALSPLQEVFLKLFR